MFPFNIGQFVAQYISARAASRDPIGAVLFIAGLITSALGAPGIGVPMMISGITHVIGTALAPAPPRDRSMSDSPTYGIDKFENPRGPELVVPILYGRHRVKPAVIAEAAFEVAEGVSPGSVSSTRRQGFRWLGVVCEGEVASIESLEINDRAVFSDERTEDLGRGNGSKKEFAFPHPWVYLGEDEAPAVRVMVDGVDVSWSRRTGGIYIVVPSSPSKTTFDVVQSDRTERVLANSIRVYIRGPGRSEFEQLRREGTYKWSMQKLAPWRVRVRFQARPPAGWTVRIAYSYLGASGMAIAQDAGSGATKVVFGTAPANGKKVTATYRTTPFRGIRVSWRPGTLDQQPMDGFTDIEQSRNPRETKLTKDAALTYSTDAREVDNLRIGLVAPNGMVWYSTDGSGTQSVSVRLRIEYRKSGGTWKTLRSRTNDTWKIVGQRSGTMRWEIDVRDELERRAASGEAAALADLDAFDRAAYEVRVTRLDPTAGGTYVIDEIHFAAVTEVVYEGYSYPGTALIGLRGVVGEFLEGSSLRVSCVATRAPLYDPRSAGGSRDIGSSQNPALAIRDLVTSSEGAAAERFGSGAYFSAADIDSTQWTALADYCDEWVHRPGDDATRPASSMNGERRCRLNMVIDTPESVSELVSDIAVLGRSLATLQGARWRFPLDADEDPVFAFVDDIDPAAQNMSGFVLHVEDADRTPTGVQASFWNESLDYERDEMYYPVDGVEEGTPTNTRRIDLRGITRETEAARMLRHLAEQAKALPYPCTWEAHPGVQHVEAGDVVTVRTRVPYSTGETATELLVRVLGVVLSTDEEGKRSARFSGRVIDSRAYESQVVPASNSRASAEVAREVRGVVGLRARVA